MSLYRNTVWLFKGLREYTKGGYQAASKKFKPEDLDVDCSGRVFMITGANSGIGKQVIIDFLDRLVKHTFFKT